MRRRRPGRRHAPGAPVGRARHDRETPRPLPSPAKHALPRHFANGLLLLRPSALCAPVPVHFAVCQGGIGPAGPPALAGALDPITCLFPRSFSRAATPTGILRACPSGQSIANERKRSERHIVGAPDAVVFKGDDCKAPRDGAAPAPVTQYAPEGWRAALDRSGRMYWIKIGTQETTYTDPRTGTHTPLLPPLPPRIQVAYAADHRMVRVSASAPQYDGGVRAFPTPHRWRRPRSVLYQPQRPVHYLRGPAHGGAHAHTGACLPQGARPGSCWPWVNPTLRTVRAYACAGVERPLPGRRRPRRRADRPLRHRWPGGADGVPCERGRQHARAGAETGEGEGPSGALATHRAAYWWQ